MAYKLPLFVRQHFSPRPSENRSVWLLKCDQCGEMLHLLKPTESSAMHQHGMDTLRLHVQSHLVPKGMHTYRVVGYDLTNLVVSHAVMETQEQFNQVREVSPGYYMILVWASNVKHAYVKARGFIQAHLTPPPTRHHWRTNPR